MATHLISTGEMHERETLNRVRMQASEWTQDAYIVSNRIGHLRVASFDQIHHTDRIIEYHPSS